MGCAVKGQKNLHTHTKTIHEIRATTQSCIGDRGTGVAWQRHKTYTCIDSAPRGRLCLCVSPRHRGGPIGLPNRHGGPISSQFARFRLLPQQSIFCEILWRLALMRIWNACETRGANRPRRPHQMMTRRRYFLPHRRARVVVVQEWNGRNGKGRWTRRRQRSKLRRVGSWQRIACVAAHWTFAQRRGSRCCRICGASRTPGLPHRRAFRRCSCYVGRALLPRVRTQAAATLGRPPSSERRGASCQSQQAATQ